MTKPRQHHPVGRVPMDPHMYQRARTEYESDQYWKGESGLSCRNTLGQILSRHDTRGTITRKELATVETYLNYNEAGRERGTFRREETPPGHPKPKVYPPPTPRRAHYPQKNKQEKPIMDVQPPPPSPPPTEPKTEEEVPLITLAQIAQAWGLKSRSRIETLIEGGQFPPPMRAGRSPRWNWEVVKRWKLEHGDLLTPYKKRAVHQAPLVERLSTLEARVTALESRLSMHEGPLS